MRDTIVNGEAVEEVADVRIVSPVRSALPLEELNALIFGTQFRFSFLKMR